MKETLAVAICQMTSTDDWKSNVDQAIRLANEAFHQGKVDLLCYPENSLYMRMDKTQKIPSIKLTDSIFDTFKELSKERDCIVYFGSVPLNIGNASYNSTVLVYPDGRVEAPYQKIHLFDIDLEGQEPLRESDEYTHGAQPVIVDIKGWKLGLSICYDLRFSELYSYYHRHEVDIIGIPAAFLVPTGKAHWHVLTRARAIEAQAYVIAAAQGGSHLGKRETYGHSLIIGPWGEILAEASEGVRVKRMVLEKSQIQHIRRQMPLKQHRRL